MMRFLMLFILSAAVLPLAASEAAADAAAAQAQAVREIGEQRLAEEVRRGWLPERAFLDNQIARLEEELRLREEKSAEAERRLAVSRRKLEDARMRLKTLAPDGTEAAGVRLEALEKMLADAAAFGLTWEELPDGAGVMRQFQVLRLGSLAAYAFDPVSGRCAIARPPDWQRQWNAVSGAEIIRAIRAFEESEAAIMEVPL